MLPSLSMPSRLLVLLAACCTVGALVLPLWRIDLEAPQYPEGIGMIIRAGTVEGVKPNDLQNINGLNHYIGMREIVPESIPELRWMPWIVGTLALLGALVALYGRRRPLLAWLALFGGVGLVGLYDFWRWGYDYGHNLDPHAIIRIPGMAYQPPLIGSKQLLNFTAHSWPAAGGVLLGVAFLLGAVAVLLSYRRRSAGMGAAAVAVSGMLAACAPAGPRAIALGEELCGYCRMAITDARFGSQVRLATGKTMVFDSIECLAGFVAATPAERITAAWVSDFTRPGTFIPVDEASFWIAGGGVSPMGKGLLATAHDTRPPMPVEAGALSWDDVVAAVGKDAGGVGEEAAHATH